MIRRILIIDDEDDIREVTALTLEVSAGWQVITAGSGDEALEKTKASMPDAILLDVMMPGTDGPAVLSRLQRDVRLQNVPVIFLTAKVQTAERNRLTSLGAAGVISKPFDPLTLAYTIGGLIGWKVDEELPVN